MTQRTDEEIISQIKELIETHIKPAVAGHGGNIEFVSYEKGHLLLELGGACSGCAGSTATLKYGVENMVKHYVPEVETIEAFDDPMSTVNPFYTDPFMMSGYDMIDMVEEEDENESNH